MKSRQIEDSDVGPSRDGDQFHYSRASRLCLELLDASSDLKVVSVERPATKDSVTAGLESIDLALYFGSTNLSTARRVCYRQLKHSTLQAEKEWTASGLRKTLEDFASRFMVLVSQFGFQDVCTRFAFEFETNRPLSPRVEQALADLRQGAQGKREARYIRHVTGLAPANLQAFASAFCPITRVDGFLGQRELLNRGLRAYLPDNDKDAAIALRDLVTRKATTEFKSNPEVRREDVLDTIGVRLDDLFPAPSALESPSVIVQRSQMMDLVKVIAESSTPVILCADGGCGKSIVASQIGPALPRSTTFVYDCFGNGGYRSSSRERHRPKDGLVQLANEMATHGLCDPLIPTPKADDGAYVNAFLARLAQASAALRSQAADATDAYLVVVLDAADNAEMAAEEFHSPPSFPRRLLAETFPDNVRLVLTSRPHRVHKLHPPPSVVRFFLDGFNEKETGDLLKTRFPEVGDVEIREFHRLTSRNPRVQRAALDLDPAASCETVLRSLGPSPRTVDDTIGDLLKQAIGKLRYAAADVERPQIDRICAALATLRPFLPIKIIALTAGVDEGLVRSFIHDLGRSLLLRDDSVQFRDEPTETWFQENFRSDQEELEAFVRRLKPLARESHYAASALPALMLSTDRFDELVRLALDDDALPESDEIARRDVQLQRLEFATRAALRTRRYADAAKLALKSGGQVAADNRQQMLLSRNVDLASRFLDADQLLEQVSRRQIAGGNWTGSEHAYEAALLSGRMGLEGEARTQLRFAYDWLDHCMRNRQESDHHTSVEDNDILELEWAELNVHGPTKCAAQLRRWRPREISYRVGRALAKRLVDAGRWADADALALAAGNDIGLVLAIVDELRSVERHPPSASAARAMRLLLHSQVKLDAAGDSRGESTRIGAVASMIDTARHYGLASKRELVGFLRRYLPETAPRILESEHLRDDRCAYLRAYASLAALLDKPLTLEFIYNPSRGSCKNVTSQERFSGQGPENLKALLPWHELSVKVRSGLMSKVHFEATLAGALEHWRKHRRDVYRNWSATADEVARLWSECIVLLGGDEAMWVRLLQWQDDLQAPLFIPTLTDLARRAALTGASVSIVLSFAQKARRRIGEDAELAESMAESFVLIARSVLGASEDEAFQYFNEAVRVASKIGQENLERWHALLHLSDACASESVDDPELAYRFARAAEITRSYVDRDKHFDWAHTVEAIATLSPGSVPAIMSRWRDRRFGEPERLLPQLIEVLLKLRHLDALDAAPLICFVGEWDWPKLIAAGLVAAKNRREKDKLLLHYHQYVRFSGCSKRDLKEIGDTVCAHGLDAQLIRELEERARLNESDGETSEAIITSGRKLGPDWEDVFAAVDLGCPSSLLESQARMPQGQLGQWRRQWIGEAAARVPAGRERAFIEGLEELDDWRPYAVQELLEQIPAIWADRLAARQALAAFVRRMACRHSTSLDVSRHYQPLSYDLVHERAGVTRMEIFHIALKTISETILPSTSRGLFQLVAVLAQFLRPAEARSVLGYGLEHLEDALGCDHGDGTWRAGLVPPGGCRESIAGYIWAALGDASSGRRWEAAHVVRALCRLDRQKMLTDVLALASGGDASAFADASFHFYRLHATQWLLIALDRASRESGDVVAHHAAWLESVASAQNNHVIFRGVAARTLLSLGEGGYITTSSVSREALEKLNKSALPTQISSYHSRPQRGLHGSGYEYGFRFDYDFTRDWIEPLARCFAIDPGEVKAIATGVVREHWGLQENGHYDRDARAMRGHFQGYTRRRGRELGGQDNLAFYLSYHALMESVGRMLAAYPLHEDPESSWGSFSHWLQRTFLLDTKFQWLADFRQFPPLDSIEFPKFKKDAWPAPAPKSYALSRLMVPTAKLVISGRWKQYQGRNSEIIRVESALVSRARADALGRALATARDPNDYALPSFEDTHEIHLGEFVLEGWLTEFGDEAGADSDDPWNGGLGRRFPNLADPVAAKLGVALDEGTGTWRKIDGTCVAWIQRWSEGVDDEHGRNPSGARLVADEQFLRTALDRLERTLILEVTCRRRIEPFSYENRNEDAEEDHSTSIITINANESPQIFGRSHRSRAKARRRTKVS